MKRWKTALTVVMVLTGLLWWWPRGEQRLAAETVSDGRIPVSTEYEANVTIDPARRTVGGNLVVRFVPVDRKAYFHLYPNTFQERADLQGENWQFLLGQQRLPGDIRVYDVRLQGNPVDVEFLGENQTVMAVSLGDSARERAEVEMRFELKIPFNNGRMSYNDHAIWLGNWLPILAVKDEHGWRLDPYYPMGDPFYSDMANYHLRVNLPEGYYLATSGTESMAVITKTRPDRQTCYEIDAFHMRDFALVVMDGTYRSTASQVGETLVRTWWQEGDDPDIVSRLHDVAVQSLAYYSKEFAAYPYREFDVVKTGGFFGGMEYPGIVFIQGDFFNTRPDYGAAVVAHETAHQWFYGLVGSDEVREAWVDESLTDYATMAFLQQYDSKLSAGYITRRLQRGRAAEQYTGKGIAAWQSLADFPDWSSYSDLVYSRGAAMMWELRQAWGEQRVHQALRNYVQEHQYGQANGVDVVEAFSRAAGADAGPYFDYWLRLDLHKEEQAKQWLEKGKSGMRFPWMK